MSLASRRKRHAAEALKYEEETAEFATAELKGRVSAASASLLGGFLRGVTGSRLATAANRAFLNIRPDVRSRLAKRVAAGVALGIEQGQEAANGLPEPDERRDRTLEDVLGAVDPAAVARLADAADLARKLPLKDRAELEAVLAQAVRAVNQSEGTARWVANRAVSMGTAAVARRDGARLVWVPERDACLHCLAYAGWVVEPGQSFPVGLSYADKPLKPFGDLIYPPLHPNCRCQVDLTYLPVGRSEVALAREAERSVARGLSNHATEPAALRAADRLFRSPTLLPRSVRERARRDVAAGKFTPRPR